MENVILRIKFSINQSSQVLWVFNVRRKLDEVLRPVFGFDKITVTFDSVCSPKQIATSVQYKRAFHANCNSQRTSGITSV